MKLQAIVFMCNDFIRLDWMLQHFTQYNPHVPLLVVNSGGDSPSHITSKYNSVSLIEAPNLWHKKTHCGVGSFGPSYYKYLFEYGLNSTYTHTLFLETDVKTNSKIIEEPLYDISGPLVGNGPNENVLYEYLDISGPRCHTGCGGTAFSLNYFKTIINKDFSFYKNLFNTHSPNYFMDLVSTLAARKNNLTFGDWDAVSNNPCSIKFKHKYISTSGYISPMSYNTSLIHNIKV